MTRVSELLAARRPHRADAARNFDAILTAARAAFSEKASEVSLEEIARRAGVGIATLYRNFPTRESLIEGVYIVEVEEVCAYADQLTPLDPGQALDAWLVRFAQYMHTKRALIEGLTRAAADELTRESAAYRTCRAAIYATGGPLLERAQAAGSARTDVDIDDVMRYLMGVTFSVYRDEDQRRRVFEMAIKTLHGTG